MQRSPGKSRTHSPCHSPSATMLSSPGPSRQSPLWRSIPIRSGQKQKKIQAEERLIVHGARDDFMAILRERKQVEMEAAMPQPIIQPKRHQGVQDIQLLTSLLKVPSEQRIHADLVLIANQIRYTGIFERLYISLDQEGALCRILQFRKFHTKGATVVHEGQCRGSFYMVLEGTLVVLASRREALEQPKGGQDEKLADQKYVLVANIIEALSVAASDKSGTSDPFVTVKLGMQEKSTSIKKETLNPIWDETLRISNVEPDDETVEISVWDHDTWGDTDFLGIVTVPMASLRENLHHVQDFALKLGEDARYQASADEAGVYYEISGSICFHLQLTTEAVLSQIEQLELGDDRAGRSKVYYTAGDTFGAEQVFSSIGMAPNSIIIEQPTTVLRVGAVEYEEQILPLQADEIHRKKEFFAELSVFSHYSEETLENMCKWFRISSFYPGQTIAQQGDDRDEIAFILTGEVSVVMDVPTLSRHHGASSRHHAPGLTRRDATTTHPIKPLHGLAGNTSRKQNPAPKHFADLVWDSSLRIMRKYYEFVGNLTRGQTINLHEALNRSKNQYSTIANTPTTILTSSKGTHLGITKGLLEPVESFDKQPGVIISVEDCQRLLDRAPPFPQGRELWSTHKEHKEWKAFKEKLVSNHVFHHKQHHHMRGPGGNPRIRGREEIDLSGMHPRFRLEPSLPDIVQAKLIASTRVLKSLEMEADTYDDYHGVLLTYKDKLQKLASQVHAPIFSYSKLRPPTAKASFQFSRFGAQELKSHVLSRDELHDRQIISSPFKSCTNSLIDFTRVKSPFDAVSVPSRL